MCGIVGWYDPSGAAGPEAQLQAAASALRHRGPDAEGVYSGPGIGLAHRRLAIIDRRPEANQPHWNEDRTIAVVCNGMIYNYRELRHDLERKGHRFTSRTDTEVIPHLYEEAGAACLEQLRGLFALAVWDARRRQLLLARDHVGQKPLFYAQQGSRWYFASEPKALWQFEELGPSLDPVGVHGYLTAALPLWSQTMYRGVLRLPPASSLLIREGRATLRTYWTPPVNSKRHEPWPVLAGELVGVLEDAVRRCALSDVPVGVMLSGGIDSSTVAAFFRRQHPAGTLETFSVGYETSGRPDPDLEAARLVAKAVGARHHELHLTPACLEELPRLLRHYDEPYARCNGLANFLLCRMAKPYATVVLTGDGGDEVFGGYSGYRQWARFDLVARSLNRLGVARPPQHEAVGRAAPDGWWRLLTAAPAARRTLRNRMAGAPLMTALYSEAFLEHVGDSEGSDALRAYYEQLQPRHFLDGVLCQDLMVQSTHGICVLSDITGMASGMELRSPYLDKAVIEFAASLPPRFKVTGWSGKVLLRRAVAPFLPHAVLARRKVGYGESLPFERWFREEWRSAVEDRLFAGSLQSLGLFRPQAIEELYRRYRDGASQYFDLLWSLTCLEVWSQACLNGPSAVARAVS